MPTTKAVLMNLVIFETLSTKNLEMLFKLALENKVFNIVV
tara:strand:+ start:85926 stop:86045 length:120 start_codon:yes stop_codon:yes gene_type:complete